MLRGRVLGMGTAAQDTDGPELSPYNVVRLTNAFRSTFTHSVSSFSLQLKAQSSLPMPTLLLSAPKQLSRSATPPTSNKAGSPLQPKHLLHGHPPLWKLVIKSCTPPASRARRHTSSESITSKEPVLIVRVFIMQLPITSLNSSSG